MKAFLSVAIFTCVVLVACSKSSQTTEPPSSSQVDCSVPKTFSADVSQIISTRCAVSGCHGSGSTNGPGELTTYQQIFNARTLIRSAVASGFMPQGSSLSSTQINAILCWIDNGALNN